MKYAGSLIELAGFVAVTYGAYQLAHWLGWIVAGVLAVVIGQVAGGNPA